MEQYNSREERGISLMLLAMSRKKIKYAMITITLVINDALYYHNKDTEPEVNA